MANEAVKLYSFGSSGDIVQDYTIADATATEKGSFMVLSNPRTASPDTNTTGGSLCAGIAAREKVANDGSTQIACHTRGDFEVVASGAVTVGEPLQLAGLNRVKLATPTLQSGAVIIGYCLSGAADGSTFDMRLQL